MDQNLYERVKDPADPRRCQYVIPTRGQCLLVKIEGTDYCVAHGGTLHQRQRDEKVMRNYRIAKYQTRIDEKAQGSQIKSLRDEIAIGRR